MYRIDNWINEGCGWIVEFIKSQYINILAYRPLSGWSFIKLPVELKSSKKGLISIKNNDQKCFLWCHVRHINSVKIHPERIKKVRKKHFNKNLIIGEKEEEEFRSSNVCWICKKLIDDDDEEVRDYCHVTGKFRGAAHW